MELVFDQGSIPAKQMDSETQAALSKAIILAVGRQVKGVGRGRKCHLHVVPGCNIENTQIEIRDKDGLVVAFYSNGAFYDSISRSRVELINK